MTEKVQDARSHARLKQLSHNGLSGLAMFGLDHDAIVYLIEQLYGANNCTNYRFRYLDYNDMQEEVSLFTVRSSLQGGFTAAAMADFSIW